MGEPQWDGQSDVVVVVKTPGRAPLRVTYSPSEWRDIEACRRLLNVSIEEYLRLAWGLTYPRPHLEGRLN